MDNRSPNVPQNHAQYFWRSGNVILSAQPPHPHGGIDDQRLLPDFMHVILSFHSSFTTCKHKRASDISNETPHGYYLFPGVHCGTPYYKIKINYLHRTESLSILPQLKYVVGDVCSCPSRPRCRLSYFCQRPPCLASFTPHRYRDMWLQQLLAIRAHCSYQCRCR